MAQASKFHAILAINPEAKFTTAKNESGEEIVTWLDGTTPISETDISAKQAELETANAHIATRKSAYPSVQEQLDKLYHDMTAGKLDTTGEWHKAIKAVKDGNPKS
jgi:hypothetical protein